MMYCMDKTSDVKAVKSTEGVNDTGNGKESRGVGGVNGLMNTDDIVVGVEGDIEDQRVAIRCRGDGSKLVGIELIIGGIRGVLRVV